MATNKRKAKELNPESLKKLKTIEEKGGVTMRVLVTNAQVGAIIGKGGEHARKLRDEHNIFVSVLWSKDEKVRITEYRGIPEDVAGALRRTCEFWGADQDGKTSTGTYSIDFLVHEGQVGSLIGPGGALAKQCIQDTGAKLNVSKERKGDSTEKVVHISGSLDSIRAATLWVINQIKSNPLPSNTPTVLYRPQQPTGGREDPYRYPSSYPPYDNGYPPPPPPPPSYDPYPQHPPVYDPYNQHGSGGNPYSAPPPPSYAPPPSYPPSYPPPATSGAPPPYSGSYDPYSSGGSSAYQPPPPSSGYGSYPPPGGPPAPSYGYPDYDRGRDSYRGDSGAGAGAGAGGGGGGGRRGEVSGARTTMKLDIPLQCISGVIGRGGSVIQNIHRQSTASIKIAEQVAGEPHRTATITGSDSAVRHAAQLIQARVAELSSSFQQQ